ncbi:MAG TPA: amino acid adenylation domain-containing protein [Actinomycetota bacterium]|nr:amino acid adenylation domain-containing protein [Actinomycetota bacterium]
MRAAFTLHGLAHTSAEQRPDAPAVADAHGTLSYAELDAESGRIATALRELGVQPGDRVAMAAEKSRASVAALYGIMRTGAAYVPIDPLAPALRSAGIIRDAACSAVCADDAAAGLLASGWEGGGAPPILGLGDDVTEAAIGAAEIARLAPDGTIRGCESDLAYLLYTSGSTGVPKGVMLTHRNALSFVEWTVDRFGVGSEDRLSSHAPFHFDLSVFDLYGAALTGACVDLLSSSERSFGADMARAIASRGITVWYSVPSALVMLCDAAQAEDLAGMRVILFAGEVFPMKHLRRLRALAPNAELANLYGPTETNVCTYHVVPDALPDDDKPLPIGTACENQEVFALDDEMRPVDLGEVGELWVRGPTVMKGYWGDEERTARTLRQNPLHDRFPDPTYRTGDLVRRLPGEVFEFLGRRDHQIKVRGYRIELGEIEAALTSHPAVREAAVVAVPDERAGALLIAFVTATESIDDLTLKKHCRDRVPRYMIPTTLIFREQLPHTSTGKIDRQALATAAQHERVAT